MRGEAGFVSPRMVSLQTQQHEAAGTFLYRARQHQDLIPQQSLFICPGRWGWQCLPGPTVAVTPQYRDSKQGRVSSLQSHVARMSPAIASPPLCRHPCMGKPPHGNFSSRFLPLHPAKLLTWAYRRDPVLATGSGAGLQPGSIHHGHHCHISQRGINPAESL